MSTAIAVQESENLPAIRGSMGAVSVNTAQWKAAIDSINEITQFVAEGLKEGIDNDYAVIPGTGKKKTLLKPGAQKICMAFNVYPRPHVTVRHLDQDHIEYQVLVELVSRSSGEVVSTGIGLCSTKEAKYRYRGNTTVDTGNPVPKGYFDKKKSDYKAAQAMLPPGCVPKKNEDGSWTLHQSSGEKQENPDIADTYNTVLKMAEKRGLLDATINLSCISQHFTQDMEERYQSSEPPATVEAEVVQPADTGKAHAAARRAKYNLYRTKAIAKGMDEGVLDGYWIGESGARGLDPSPEHMQPAEFKSMIDDFGKWIKGKLDEMESAKAEAVEVGL